VKISREWVVWLTILSALTIAMLAVRAHLNQAHVALAYLLVVQLGSARGGRPLGLTLAALAFLSFDFLFLPPYYTFVVQNPLNWLVLAAFLVTSIVSAQLLYRAQAEADEARQRAAEIDRLASLGAETLNAARAEEALTAIVSVIRSTIGLDDAEVYSTDEHSGAMRLASKSPASPSSDGAVAPIAPLVEWVATHGQGAVEHVDGTTRVGVDPADALRDDPLSPRARAVLRPLQIRGRTVGLLRITRASGLALSAAQIRVLDALAYYAALGVERVQLAAEAERAAALQEAHRAKDAVLASVSHDLRTPLTAIKGLAHEIADGGDERAEIIEEQADSLSAFVAKLLDLSRVASGAAVPDVQANEVEDLVGAVVQRTTGCLGDHELKLDLDPSEPLLFGRFDFAQTVRALVNLVENAAKYSPPGEPIDISVRRDGPALRFAVADRGPGVPASERERIFEPFYRNPRSGPDVGGAGLGLSIARGIAEAQGGALTYATREGGGSMFTLTVPAVDLTELEVDVEP
jgi:two-component system, OmpR family, sensor histidine kinase KdpD